MSQHPAHGVFVRVEQLAVHQRIQLTVEPEVEEPVEWVLTFRPRQFGDVASHQSAMPGLLYLPDLHVLEAVIREPIGHCLAASLRFYCFAEPPSGHTPLKLFGPLCL